MGISTQTAGRIFKAQKYGDGAEDTPLAMDKLPHVALSRVSTRVFTILRQHSYQASD